MNALTAMCRQLWKGLRSISGDDAYERYLEHQRRRHPDAVPLERAEFHAAEAARRWSQVNRCC
jgi:uncharacterized short protein YbdD (DUF466 family)